MKIPECPVTTFAWDTVSATQHPGESGAATQRQFAVGDTSLRIVEYSAGYKADHWCPKGHIALILEGELVLEVSDGRAFTLTAGMTFVCSDDAQKTHRAYTRKGAKLFLVD